MLWILVTDKRVTQHRLWRWGKRHFRRQAALVQFQRQLPAPDWYGYLAMPRRN
jgi:hypothetical protein